MQPIELLVPDRFRCKHIGYRNAFFANPTTRSMGVGRDLFARRKDGSEFPCEIGLNVLELNDGSNQKHVLAAVVDVSERRRAEELFRKVAVAEQVSACACSG